MAWIESHQSLLTHRKTGRLARVLRTSRVTSIGHLHAVWWWCMDNAPDGDLSDIEPEELAEAAMWEGDPTEFVEALISAGFIDQCDGELVVHDWNDYAGKLIEKRKSDAERKRRLRSMDNPLDVHGTSNGHPSPVQVDGAGTVPTVPTKPTNKKPPTPSPSVGFDVFWQDYPKKIGKAVAEKSWRLLKPDEQTRALIAAGLDKAKASPQWTKDGGQFIPHAATWLNQRRWEDEYSPPLRLVDESIGDPDEWGSPAFLARAKRNAEIMAAGGTL